jgi:hypothetical protein
LPRFAESVLLTSLALSWSEVALAQTTSETAPEDSPSERTIPLRSEVVVGVVGPLDPDARATLARLLRAELEPHGLVLVERDPSGETRAWARDVANEKRHLLAALLDTKRRTGWRLVVIDTARGRAISRELPGGERDAANVEAIVSIVVSATNALREGLEVASAPLETVVEPNRPPPPPPPPTPRAPKSEPSAGTTLHGSLTATSASFSEAAEPTLGGSLALGVSIASWIDVDVGGTRYLPVSVDSAFGSFTLERSALSLTAGPVLRSGSFTFVPALGITGEWIARRDTLAAQGVARADEEPVIRRFGGALAIRGRYRLLSSTGDAEFVSVIGALGASYFGDRIRFLAGPDLLAEARRSAFGAELGLFIATDPL